MTTTTGIFIRIAVALVLVLISVAGFRQIDTCEDHDWVPIVIIEGIFFIGLLAGLFGSFGHETEKEEKVNIAIKTTVNANYNDVVNFHNDDTNKSFVSDGSKYTFDYDEETKTLTVFTDTNSNVDAVFVDGTKQKGEKYAAREFIFIDILSACFSEASISPDRYAHLSMSISLSAHIVLSCTSAGI